MKIFLFFILLFVFANHTFAQDTGDGMVITYGFAVGYDLGFFRTNKINSGVKGGLGTDDGVVGINTDFKLNDYFSVKPGLYYMIKGGEIDMSDDYSGTPFSTGNYKLHYFEIPLLLIGHMPVGDGANIFLGGGPFYAKGTNGKIKMEGYPIPDVNLTLNNNGDFKSKDIGATMILGFQGASGYSISGNLDFGFTNVLQNNVLKNSVSSLKTMAIYISVGKAFY